MPRFFFDLVDGDRHLADVDGQDMTDVRTACSEARRALCEIALDWLPDEGRRAVVCRIRGESDDVVRVLSLSIDESVAPDRPR